ncbi:hypothetical protein P0R31_25705 [Bradyrhizobium yuanmingense]|uniref:NACHT domain-containing protein n=1 Tax=Bradyrhizobium yuanmingense TaxID=108015 RepID=UPI0023B9028B|nr:NACHT domain-containing protein [Bradyrhizobium yuanmingense]MDF0520645.1 hypothetical protein [Bradyrhizobium yuanmingense]
MSKLPGDELRDNIAVLLRMKYSQVETEKRLASTTADVWFVDDTNEIFPRKIAIEAKDWGQRLTSENLASIFNLYNPSISNREIDHLWIIGRLPLSGSPKLSLDRMPNVRYSTFEEFRASLMNFSGFLNHNIFMFEHHDAYKNFVDARIRNSGTSLLNTVLDWLETDRTGLVVYGGYGLGKTTFSLFLASLLSKKRLAGEFDRIPIRIALGGLYSKQDVVALICSALSGGESGTAVKDFTYGLFLEMNRQGQYLLILDGFDEMRHAMDLDDFVYTFEQMKPLFSGNAKVIILGRPDSFLSTQEEVAVLSALFDEASETARKLDTVEVSFFSKDEVKRYLDNYIANRAEPLSEEQRNRYEALINQLPDSEDNILSRPVQLNMFTKIFEQCLSEDMLFNRYELFARFIYRFMDREGRKPARQPSDGKIGKREWVDARARFMQAVAWWLLNTKKENRFVADEIPIDIIPPEIRSHGNTAADVREAIVGSVIEPISQSGVLGSKARRYYYFPHKSYLEFLVANYFDRTKFSIDVFRDFLSNVNSEILSFLKEGPETGLIHLRQGLLSVLGTIDPRIIETCATDKQLSQEVLTSAKSNHHASTIYTHYFYVRKRPNLLEPYLLARLADSSTVDSLLATFNCISAELAASGSVSLARALLMNCVTGISVHSIRRYLERGETTKFYRADGESLRAALLSACVTKKFSVLMSELPTFLFNASANSFYVNIHATGTSMKEIVLPVSDVVKSAPIEYAELLQRMADASFDSGSIFPVVLHDAASDRFGGVATLNTERRLGAAFARRIL